jgi:predicted dehydrogenase
LRRRTLFPPLRSAGTAELLPAIVSIWALIGVNGMGRGNLANCARHEDVVVTALCDVWQARMDPVSSSSRATATGHRDYRELLARKDVDAVIIASPPHWHALMAVEAVEAGKDIYLQKPMTLYPDETLAVRNAVNRHERISQIGTQIHAGENYRRVVEWIQSGKLGPVGVVRTFNVMNQGPDGIGHAPQQARARRSGLGSVARARPGDSVQLAAGVEQLQSLLVHAYTRRLDAGHGAPHRRPARVGAESGAFRQ